MAATFVGIVTDRDVHRAGDPGREVDSVEIVQRFAHLLDPLGIEALVLVYLLIGPRMRERSGIHEAAEVGSAGCAAGDLARAKRRCRDCQCATLAATLAADPARIDF